MANVVLGIATSHGPQLNTPVDSWQLHVERDQKSRELFFRGGLYTFEDLVREREVESLDKQITAEKMVERYQACQKAIVRLGEILTKVRPDIAVIIGDDQKEVFLDDNMPAFSVYWGETVDNAPIPPEHVAKRPRGLVAADWGTYPPIRMTHPCEAGLAKHIIESLMQDDFDVAYSRTIPVGRFGNSGISHAHGFVYRRLMDDKVIPNVPLFINAFYPPNQPTLKRCYDFGKALRRSIESWDGETSVAVIASGGLSHYVIEEDLDQQGLDAIKKKNEKALLSLPLERFQGGTSEFRNWVAIAGVMAESNLDMRIIDYVPCYRSLAGTGCAMAFANWL